MKKRLPLIYLSGPMTGIKELNIPTFNKVAKALRKRGYKVINPPELDAIERKRSWEGCLRRDLKYVVKCEEIATLPGWKRSKGANLEIHVGRQLSMDVHSATYYLERQRFTSKKRELA